MGSEEFASSVASTSSVGLSASGSASASGCVYNYLNGIHNDNITLKDIMESYGLNEDQINLKIKYFYKYEIPTIDEDSVGWANLGINLVNLFTLSNYDLPYHWFLIGETEAYKDGEKTKKLYYLIEKTDKSKGVDLYYDIDAIKRDERNNYNNNNCTYLKCCSLKRDTTIKDLLSFIKYNTSDKYDLIEDNCQDFVRCILNYYC